MSQQNSSIPSGGSFNSRIAPESPKPVAPAVQPLPQPPTSRFVTKNTDLTDSSVRTTDIKLDAVRDSVAAALAAHDRHVAESNGADLWTEDAARLNAAVKAGTMTAVDAERIFTSLHPEVTPSQLRGGK
jgi:hypothetical protein